MHGFLPIFFLLVVLKIPVLGALWLVWWAAQEPKTDEEASPGDDGHGRRTPIRPRPRGPHPATPGGLQRGRAAHSGQLASPPGRAAQGGHPSRSHAG